jgi:hypothetical protein
MSLKASRARTPYSYGPFYDRLVERFPEHRTVQHVFDVPRLGRELKLTGETTYRLFRHDLVPPKTAVKLLALHTTERERQRKKDIHVKKLTKIELIEYVIHDPD